MTKKGDYVYVHKVFSSDESYGLRKGVYKVDDVHYGKRIVYVDCYLNNKVYRVMVLSSQYNKVLPSKINKLLYKGL